MKQQSSNEDQAAALYGPQARHSEYCKDEVITFRNKDTRGQQLTGTVLFVRASGPASQGGRVIPACYIVFVAGESFPRVVFYSDVVVVQDP